MYLSFALKKLHLANFLTGERMFLSHAVGLRILMICLVALNTEFGVLESSKEVDLCI